MGVKKKRRMTAVLAVIWCILLSVIPVFGAGDDYRIEQLYINMPDVTAYYRSSQGDNKLEAYLGGEKLTLKDVENFSKTGEAVEYYVLLDISGSITGERFADIKTALTQFRSELRENDSLILLTFGNEVTQVLGGTEDQQSAAAVINGLQNDNANTVLFDAINTAADMIWKVGDSSEKRRIITVISDGKDCADDTRNAESTENTLKSRGIPVYTMAVENNEGDTEAETQNYRSKFAAMARNTGGVPWTVADGGTALDGLHTVRDAVMNSYRARFQASSNRVSNKKEDFVLKFLSAGNMSDTCSVLVSRGQKDETAPEIKSVTSEKADSISITFTKPVENAKDAGNYTVTRDGEAVPVKQVVAGENAKTEVTLLFDEDLYEADYEIQLKNITGLRRKSSLQISGSVCFHIFIQVCLINLDRHIIGGILSVSLFEVRRSFLVGIHSKSNFSGEEITACIHGKIFSKCLAVCHGVLILAPFQLCGSTVGQDIFAEAFAYIIAVQCLCKIIHGILIFTETQACNACPTRRTTGIHGKNFRCPHGSV